MDIRRGVSVSLPERRGSAAVKIPAAGEQEPKPVPRLFRDAVSPARCPGRHGAGGSAVRHDTAGRPRAGRYQKTSHKPKSGPPVFPGTAFDLLEISQKTEIYTGILIIYTY